ncbi:MAG: hypothetical protein HKL89_06130 [Candidatus Dormibacteraeota bacterium]|nr:hypothetical protein [Candidatus Dormibacteraeota bacterium]
MAWQPDDMTLAGAVFEGRPSGFEDALRQRVQFPRAAFGAWRLLLPLSLGRTRHPGYQNSGLP